MSTGAFTEAWLFGQSGTEFYTRTYIPSAPVRAGLVFVHGFIEHVARYEHVFPSYAQSGILVFAFDQRGFGRTALDPGEDGKRQKERIARKEGYGRTSSEQQKLDISWALDHLAKELAERSEDGQKLPLFLMGHSMGGGLVLSFGTCPPTSFSHELAGVVATSPLLVQTHPAPKIIRQVGGVMSLLSPWTTIQANINAEDISHDKEVSEAYMKDPLVRHYGTLRGVSTMLKLGELVLSQECKSWPVDLPVLLIHGTEDKITSHAATQNFYNNIVANDKTFSSYENGYHELHNEPQLKQRLIDEVISWAAKHVPQVPSIRQDTPGARL